MTAMELCKVEKSELASADVCKGSDLLAPYLNASFRFLAITHETGNNESGKLQRWYTMYTAKRLKIFKLATADDEDTCILLKSSCTYTRNLESDGCTWALHRHDRKYQIRLQNANVGFRLCILRYDKICLKLVMVIRGKDERAFKLVGSFVAHITAEINQVLCEFPDECPDFSPHEILYTFSIEKP